MGKIGGFVETVTTQPATSHDKNATKEGLRYIEIWRGNFLRCKLSLKEPQYKFQASFITKLGHNSIFQLSCLRFNCRRVHTIPLSDIYTPLRNDSSRTKLLNNALKTTDGLIQQQLLIHSKL